MIITRYGFDTALPILIISLCIVIGAFFISNISLKVGFLVFGSFLFLFTLNFFRDPERKTPAVEGAVVSPADGKVLSISEVDEPEYLQGRAKQVCIFMSPLNVHVNRYPISGRIDYYRYIEGKYLVAFEDKASEVNERTLIGINDGSRKILFKQIAGFIARRIVCPIKLGEAAVVGERFGMIKFGSRVDVLLPLDSEIKANEGDAVTAGETILAVLKRG